ncbi:uncharacterized protein ARB_03567 [Trichophyton benhamiae CBS 112371]|uniref:DUF1774 domain protein n=1 Tax=Arthroderma benhamiae (strain ATCC MYA-4681 / CBS 112371) TaxID=663331 RepID=D4B527_ARTBC|nr:uncharacterized protein ARB_03567 [Trichophyton benhamiae CBS 112371]EFE29575.1 conserved hypothetical protein [Trichophyton benhamiae CBS 112371]
MADSTVHTYKHHLNAVLAYRPLSWHGLLIFTLDNPFVKRSSYQRSSIWAYQAASTISWLLVVGFGIYSGTHRKHHGTPEKGDGDALQALAHDDHLNAFSQTKVVTGIYWIILLISQLGYIGQLWSSDEQHVTTAANVAPYFVLNNLFVLAFTLLFTHAKFWWAEVFDIFSLINQATLYWSFPGLHPFIHLPVVAGPYAWSLLTLFWNGAVAVGSNSTPLRLVANVFIWVFFVYGQAHIVIRNDQYLGYALSLLTFCKSPPPPIPVLKQEYKALTLTSLALSLKQLAIKIISLQWIFAFTIFGIFAASSLYSTVTNFLGLNFFLIPHEEPEQGDREREPLLTNE